MVPIILLESFLWSHVDSEKWILDFLKIHFFGHHMNKLRIFKVLKIGVSKSNHRLS